MSTRTTPSGVAWISARIASRRVDAGIVHCLGPVDGLTFDRVLTMPRVAVVPARSPCADADRLTLNDIDEAAWAPVAAGDPRLSAWAGPSSQPPCVVTGIRNPAAIPATVSTTGRVALRAAAAARFYPRPDIRFAPLDGPACDIAIATRESDNRPAIEAIRKAARLLATTSPRQALRGRTVKAKPTSAAS